MGEPFDFRGDGVRSMEKEDVEGKEEGHGGACCVGDWDSD